jgi:hypothetical protein
MRGLRGTRSRGAVHPSTLDATGTQGNGRSWRSLISPDGLRAVFESAATNLVPGDTNGKGDIFVRRLP